MGFGSRSINQNAVNMKTKHQKIIEEMYIEQGWDRETAEEMANDECASRAGDYPEEEGVTWWGAF